MLVLSRKVGEQICMPEMGIVVTVVAIHRRRVQLGITAPANVSVARQEVGRRDSKSSTELVDPEMDIESS